METTISNILLHEIWSKVSGITRCITKNQIWKKNYFKEECQSSHKPNSFHEANLL